MAHDSRTMLNAGDAYGNTEPLPKRGWRRSFNAGWTAGGATERAACAELVRAEIGMWSALSHEGVNELLKRIASKIEARGKE